MTMDLFDCNNIEKQSISDFSEKAYLNYSMYVILDRALPHISDGLKPVQRRIIYSMSEIGLNHLSKYKKSARTVGDVLGKYHPHGDSACYEAMVLMAQSFSYRYPFIDGQGNWGSIDDPKSFAAMRYTESKLSKYSTALLDELKSGTVEWVKNFDGTLNEPKLLPSKVPNILLNGAMGIAVGMSTYIPPHNITEIINACLYLLSNSNASFDDIFNIIKAPDYPCGADIITTKKDIKDIYQKGFGNIYQRAVYSFDSNNNLVITRLPHQVSSSNIMEQIANQIKSQKISWVKNIQDESDSLSPVKIVLYANTNLNNMQRLLKHLLATTDLEKSYKINMNMIGLDNKPKVKNLLSILKEWLEFRKNILIKKIEFNLDKVLSRLHILEGLLIAFNNIDEIINIIRLNDNSENILIKKFNISPLQAEAILNIRLKKLAKIQEKEIIKEQVLLLKDKNKLESYLNSNVKLKNLMKKEFQEILNNFGDLRRSKIIYNSEKAEKLSNQDTRPIEKVTIILSKLGWVRYAKSDNINPTTLNYKPEDEFYLSSVGYNNKQALFFTKLGKVYSLYVDSLPSARSYGEHITSYLKLDKNDRIIDISFVEDNSKYLILSTQAKGFLTDVNNLISNRNTGKSIINLDNSLMLQPYKIGSDLLKVCFVTKNGYFGIKNIEDISELKKGKGKTLLKLDNDDLFLLKLITNNDNLKLISGKRHISILSKDFDKYLINNKNPMGNQLPQGFRKVTEIMDN